MNKWTVLGIFLMIAAAGAMGLSVIAMNGAHSNVDSCIATYEEYKAAMDNLVAAKDRQINAQTGLIDALQRQVHALSRESKP